MHKNNPHASRFGSFFRHLLGSLLGSSCISSNSAEGRKASVAEPLPSTILSSLQWFGSLKKQYNSQPTGRSVCNVSKGKLTIHAAVNCHVEPSEHT
jgi:hypothetical protein